MDSKSISAIIISKVEEFFYDDDMSTQITEWGKKYCHSFDCKNPEQIEQPIENMKVFKDYCALIEEILTNCITEAGYNASDLNNAINDEYDNVKQKNLAFASILLSYTDYFAFYELMYDINNGGEAIFCPALIECDDSEIAMSVDMDSKCSDSKHYDNDGDTSVHYHESLSADAKDTSLNYSRK